MFSTSFEDEHGDPIRALDDASLRFPSLCGATRCSPISWRKLTLLPSESDVLRTLLRNTRMVLIGLALFQAPHLQGSRVTCVPTAAISQPRFSSRNIDPYEPPQSFTSKSPVATRLPPAVPQAHSGGSRCRRAREGGVDLAQEAGEESGTCPGCRRPRSCSGKKHCRTSLRSS